MLLNIENERLHSIISELEPYKSKCINTENNYNLLKD